MNSYQTSSDPGALLGKAVLKIVQVLLAIFAIACGYLAYLISEGFFSDLDIEVEEELIWLFPTVGPETWVFYFLIAISLKCLLWVGFLAWLGKKI